MKVNVFRIVIWGLIVLCITTTTNGQEKRLFEDSFSDSSSEQDIFRLYLDSIDKYLYRDTELVKETFIACESLISKGTKLSDSLIYVYKYDQILYHLANSNNLAAYKVIANNKDILENKALSERMLDNTSYIKGFTYMALGDLEAAQSLYYQNIESGKLRQDTGIVVSNLYSLGQLYSDDGDYESAIKYYKEALSLDPKKSTRPSTVVLLYAELGESYNDQGETALAIKTLDEGLNYARSEKLQVLELDLLIHKGRAYLKESQLEEADQIHNEILAIQKKGIDKLGETNINLFSAQYYDTKGDQDRAISYYDNLLTTADSTDYDTQLFAYQNLHKLNNSAKKYKVAYDYLIKYEEINTKILNDAKRQKTAYLKVKFETAQKEKDNQLLESELVKNKTEKSLLYSLIGIFLLLLSIIFYAYYQKNGYNKKLKLEVDNRTARLNESNRLLKESNVELDEFNKILSHDLKEPIRSIVSFSQLASKTSVNKSTDQYINIVTKSGKNLNQLIDSVGEYRSIHYADGLVTENLDLNEVVDYSICTIRKALPKKQIKINVAQLPTILANKKIIRSIFITLLENAAIFNREDRVEVTIDYSQDGINHIFKIKDNGIGISPVYHNQVFDMFKRLNSREEFPGSGLGLSIAKKSVTKLGGKLSILQSDLGQGSTFKLEIPITSNLSN